MSDSNNDGIGDFAGLTEKNWVPAGSASPRCGCCRSPLGRRLRHRRSTRHQTRFRDDEGFAASSRKPRGAACGSSPNSSSTTPPTSTTVQARPPLGSPIPAPATGIVWSDTDQKYPGTRIIFTDTEKSNWTWNPEAGQSYWHRFFSHQPDLNLRQSARRERALVQVMKRWLDTGVEYGFRLDAIPYLCERDGTNNEKLPRDPHRHQAAAHRASMPMPRARCCWPRAESMAGGRAGIFWPRRRMPRWPITSPDAAHLHGDRAGRPFPITDILRQTPDIPKPLPVGVVPAQPRRTDAGNGHRRRAHYCGRPTPNVDSRVRINVGIRRRLAPLMDNQPAQDRTDEARCCSRSRARRSSITATKSAWATTSISATATAPHPDDSGHADRNGGFSRADPARLYVPTIMDPGPYGYEAVNVEAQSRSLSSRAFGHQAADRGPQIHDRFGRGTMIVHRPENRSVRAMCASTGDRRSRASPICRDRRKRPNSTSPPSRPYSAGNARPHRVSRRSANCPT